ncbi:hypothetical protein [Streptomyces sp. NRRL F-2664]|nr:hypothetical protein [Streptomyces sp. NRRL F-2664]
METANPPAQVVAGSWETTARDPADRVLPDGVTAPAHRGTADQGAGTDD